MKISILLSFLFLLCSACGITGDHFFIRNYENSPVNIRLRYFNYTDENITFDYKAPNTAKFSNKLLKNKELYPFFKKPFYYFDSTLTLTIVDSSTYEFELPAKSTLCLSPVYIAKDNIEMVIINSSDTIKCLHNFPYVANNQVYEDRLFRYKFQFVGDSYYILNIKLNELQKAIYAK